MKYEDFKDNESLEKMVEELRANGTNVVVGVLDDVINWGRSNSLWPLTFATSCCGIEFMSVGAARYDMARFGFEVARASPRQADFIMVAGTIVHKMAPVLKRLIRPNGRTEICDCRRWLRRFGRSFQKFLSRAQWCGRNFACRCVYSRLSRLVPRPCFTV